MRCALRGFGPSLRSTLLPAGSDFRAGGFDDLTTSGRRLAFLAFGLLTLPTVHPVALIFFLATYSFLPTCFGTMQTGSGPAGFTRV